MTKALRETGRELIWTFLAFLHRAGLSRSINRLANRFEKIDSSPFVRRRRYGSVQILIYHRVARRPDSFLPALPLSVFERQMECLARRFNVLALSEAVEALERKDVPRNAVVITFDDGYRDNFEAAYPVLAARSLPATVFLTTGVIGTNRILWHDRLFRILNETEAAAIPDFGPNKEDLAIDGATRREAACARVLGHLMTLDPESRDLLIDQMSERLGVADATDSRLMLSWEEVRQMHRGNISFGAHTVTHPVLSRIPSDRAESEILESKREIEDHLEAPVTAFAYPNGRAGDFDVTTKRVLKEAGFRCALTTIRGTNSPSNQAWDPYELRREGVDVTHPALFEAKMNAYRFLF